MRFGRCVPVVVLIAMMLSATVDASARSAIRFGPPVTALQHCDALAPSLGLPFSSAACYEPTVAVDRSNRMFVTDAFGATIGVSTNGGRSFTARPGPPAPAGDAVLLGDAIVQIDPRGRLVFSNIYTTGLQVAVSSSGGRTWDSNVVVGAGPVTFAPFPDRQWVVFGRGNAVFVVWNELGEALSSTSRDGGRTFEPPQPFLGTTRIFDMGQPVVDRSGRAYVPIILDADYGDPYATAIAVSSSGFEVGSFGVHVVQTEPSDFFPMVAVSPHGRVAMAWRGTDSGSRAVRVSSSNDHGRTWSTPETWSRPYQATSSPWISFRDDRNVDIVWFGVTSAGHLARMFLSRGPANGDPSQRAIVNDVFANSASGRSEANTDYAHFTRLRDGRIATVWCDTSVYLSVEEKAR